MADRPHPVRVLTVVGARPQFVKAATLSAALRDVGGIEELLVHTGQHSDTQMSAVFFAELGIVEPAYELGIQGGGHGDMTGRMLAALEPVMEDEQPDAVVVYGDTNSTLAGALVATKLNLAIVHVEAGLRSFNRRMPEEINRVVTDHVSDLLFCPTKAAVANLEREGINTGVHHTGDLMYDASIEALRRAAPAEDVLARYGLPAPPYKLATIHRPGNTDDATQLRKVLEYLAAEAREYPVVWPLHPRTRLAAERQGLALDGVSLCPPLGYLDMTALVAGAALVLTDSGGLQKEAYFHRIPCVTVRDETEWTETVDAGWNRLWHHSGYRTPRMDIEEYGDGHAAALMARLIAAMPGRR